MKYTYTCLMCEDTIKTTSKKKFEQIQLLYKKWNKKNNFKNLPKLTTHFKCSSKS